MTKAVYGFALDLELKFQLLLYVAVVRKSIMNPIFLISHTSEEHSSSSQLHTTICVIKYQLRYYYTMDASRFSAKNWIRFNEMSSMVKDQMIH